MGTSRGITGGPALVVLFLLRGGVDLCAEDCNQNGVEDDADIASTTSLDCNVNGVPDECDVRPGALAWMDGQDVALADKGGMSHVSLGDLDGDEDLDLVAADIDGNGVLASLNDGDGTFGPGVRYSGSGGCGGCLPRVTLGDFDGDQDLDIAHVGCLGGCSSFLWVLLNRSDGSFADAVDYGSGIEAIRNGTGGDVDGDGDLDLVVASQTHTVTVKLNQGDGTFPTSSHHGSLPASYVTTGDLDGDGDLDIVTDNGRDNAGGEPEGSVSVFLNLGQGSFGDPVTFLDSEHYQTGVTGADFDGDGDIDLAVGNVPTLNVSVLLNEGGAIFGAPRSYRTGLPFSLTPGDFDGDRDLDLALVARETFVLLNQGSGTFGAPMSLGPGGINWALATVNLDGDQDLDLVITSPFGPSAYVKLNVTPAPFSRDCNTNGIPDECELASRDCNGNGTPDDCDIAAGGSLDEDGDGIPDECPSPGPLFLRGDCNSDGEVRGLVTDAVFLLNFNFLGGARPSCLAACDANADGDVIGVVTDAVYLLTFNFLGGSAPPAPFPACGRGTEDDEALGCETPPEACAPAG